MLQPTYKQREEALEHMSGEGRMTLDALMGYYSGVYACVGCTLGEWEKAGTWARAGS